MKVTADKLDALATAVEAAAAVADDGVSLETLVMNANAREPGILETFQVFFPRKENLTGFKSAAVLISTLRQLAAMRRRLKMDMEPDAGDTQRFGLPQEE